MAGAFYGTPDTSQGDDSLLGNGKAPEAISEAPTPSSEDLEVSDADTFYGAGAEQVPPDHHYPELTDFYESMERGDRVNGEEVDSAAFRASSEALQQFAVETGLGLAHMSTMMSAAKDAVSNPIASLADLEARNAHCLATLKSAWGTSFDQNMAYAKGEAARLCKTVPNAGQMLDLGAGSDPALVKLLAEAGRTRSRRK